MQKSRNKPYSIWNIFFAVIKVDPVRFILQYALAAVSSVLLGLFIVQLQNVFNHTALAVEAPSGDHIRALLGSLFVLFLCKYGSEGFEIINGYIGDIYYSRCAAYFLDLYNQKIAKASALSFEEEDNLNLYRKAMEGATAGRGMLHFIMDVLTMYTPYFLTIILYLAQQDACLLAIIPLVAVPLLLTNRIKKKHYAQLHSRAVRPQRRKEEYAKYLSELSYCREIRTGQLFPFFYEKYLHARSEYNQCNIAANRKVFAIDLGTKIITLLGFLAVMGLLMQRLAAGIISIGTFGAVFYSLDEMYSLMEEVLVSRIAGYTKALPALKAFVRMMNTPHTEAEETEQDAPFTELALENVSFLYPSANRMALKNISFEIHRNDKIAIVGYNGSGKSTLAKILTGLYRPSGGAIVLDHTPGREPRHQNASVMFQRFNRYKETVLNNVRISEKQDAEALEAQEKKRVDGLLKKVRLDFSAQEDTVDVLCAREFGGIDLSGGQWQKLAAARMLYRDRSFVVLDEPTAKIDPISEDQLFHLFEQELRDKTAIIITHRMASIAFCNKIIVLQDGEIEAIGDHETLMKTSPLYYALYHSVEENYR